MVKVGLLTATEATRGVLLDANVLSFVLAAVDSTARGSSTFAASGLGTETEPTVIEVA
jgi:hypothetical protein